MSSEVSALFQIKNSDKRQDDHFISKAVDDCEEPLPAANETQEYLDNQR